MTRRGFLGLASALPFAFSAKASEHPASEKDEFKREALRLQYAECERLLKVAKYLNLNPPRLVQKGGQA